MGVFDFLYKARPKPEHRVHPRSYSQQPSHRPTSHHYQQRTTTYVKEQALNNRSNSLPNEPEPEPLSPREYPSNQKSLTTRSYNQKHDSSHAHKYKLRSDNVDYYKAPKPADIEDDFTRLSRLEVKIDEYIKRHNKLSVELNTIEQNLSLILNEFNDEFQDSIGKSNNRHTQEIGVRILTKLNDFCSIDNSVELRPNEHPPMEPNQKMPKKQSRALSPANLPKSRKSSTESDSTRTSTPNRGLARAVQPSPTPPAPPKMLPSTFPTSPLVNSHSTHYRNNRDFTFNQTGIEKENAGDFGPPNLVKAHYARVDTSTPYTTDTVTRLTHYKSTPSLVHANQSLSYENSPQYAAEESYLNDLSQPKTMYINMSSTVHSNHPLIEHCFRRIELLRPRIMGYKSEHKLSVYKELDNEIIQLMNSLDAADCGNVPVFRQDSNIAYCELHNLAGVLERAIDCTDPECVICNSFIYKQEISV